MDTSSESSCSSGSDDEYYDYEYCDVEEDEEGDDDDADDDDDEEEEVEFLSEGLADLHTTLMSQQKEYDDKVTFFLGAAKDPAGDAGMAATTTGAATAKAPKTRQSISGQVQARQSSAALGRGRNAAATASRVGKGMNTRASVRDTTTSAARQQAAGQKNAQTTKDGTADKGTTRAGRNGNSTLTPKAPLTGPRAKEAGTVSFRTRSKASQSMANFSRDSSTRSMANVRAGGQRVNTREPGTKPRSVAGANKAGKSNLASASRTTVVGKSGTGLASASRTSVASQRQFGAKTGKELGTLKEIKEPAPKTVKEIKSPGKSLNAARKSANDGKGEGIKRTQTTGNKIPAPLTELSHTSSSESDQKIFSESSDGDLSPVKLYQPKPTLKELAEGKPKVSQRNRISFGRKITSNNKPKQETAFSFNKAPETIMSIFEEREKEFREQFYIAVGPTKTKSGVVDIPPSIKEDQSNKPVSNFSDIQTKQIKQPLVHYKQTHGFNHLENLLMLMDQLSNLRTENHKLKRKCSYLEDVGSLLNLQNQMMSASRVKQMNKTESFISKAQSKVKHYLASPTPNTHTYHRVNSEGAPLFLTDPAPKSPLQRSSSVGSIEELDLVATIADPQMRSHSSDKSRVVSSKGKSIGKKVNKSRILNWTKKKVFGKPESPGKVEGGAISAEEIIRVNKERGTKPRPPLLPNSKSFDHHDLMSGSVSDDNSPFPDMNHLSVENTFNTPPSPASCHSEPGVSAFPATTPTEKEIEELSLQSKQKKEFDEMEKFSIPLSSSAPTTRGLSIDISAVSPTPADFSLNLTPRGQYIHIGGTQSVRTTVRTLAQENSAYSNKAYNNEEQLSISDSETDKSKIFEFGVPMVRRKSSPTLSLRGSANELSSGLSAPIEIKRSSSFKIRSKKNSGDIEDRIIRNTAYITENLLSPEDAKRAQLQMRNRGSDGGDVHRKAKAAWFKVKDIIHTRKDSIKKRRRRSVSGGEELFGEMSQDRTSSWGDRMSLPNYEYEAMVNAIQQDRISEGGGVTSPPSTEISSAPSSASVSPTVISEPNTAPNSLSRSQTVKPSGSPKPMRKRASSVKNPYEVLPLSPSKRESIMLPTQGTPAQLQALMGSINEDFHKKMADWEDKKKKGGICGEDQKNVNFTDDFIKKMEQWERMKGLESTSPPKTKEAQVSQKSSPPSVPPVAELPNLAGGETVEHLSETFSKTVQEWERIKEQRARGESEDKDKSGRSTRPSRPERSKSRDRERHPRDKSRQRYEREIQKREQKLEKERQKLDRLKQKLDHPHEWHNEGVQSDFLSKFYDWELLKNFNNALSAGEQSPSRSGSQKRRMESVGLIPARERVMSDSLLDHLVAQDLEGGISNSSAAFELSGEGFAGSGSYPSSPTTQPTSPLVDDSTSIDIGLTMETIAMLEAANEKLSIELSEREDELENLQDRSEELNEKLHKLTEQRNSDIEQYKKDLWASSKIGHYTIESQNLTSSLKQLKQKLNELQEYGEKVMQERKHANLTEVSEKEQISKREEELLAQIESIQRELDCKTYVQGTEVFDTLYRYIHNVHKQVDSLQCGVLERDTLINSLHHHVMIQEVYNHLLNSELQRRDAALNFLKQHRKAGILRRWNTFHGQDITIREDGSIELKKGKDQESYCILPPSSVKRLAKETDDLIKDRSEAMSLHFDWLESIKDQIKEVHETRTSDIDIQACTDVAEVDSQTLLSLLNPKAPLWRYQWDGTEVQVKEQAVQHRVTTADAAVFIEDLDIYERKLKSKKKLSSKKAKKLDKTVPKRGTVSKRMELFDPRLKEKSPEPTSKKLSSKSDDSIGDEEEESQNKTVIGKKVLDYEQCEYPLDIDEDIHKEIIANRIQTVKLDFEPVEPLSVIYRESCADNNQSQLKEPSTSSMSDTFSSDLNRISVSGCSDIEVSYTLTLVEDTDDENAKDLKNEKDTKRRKYSTDDDLVFVEAVFSNTPPAEIAFHLQQESSSTSDDSLVKSTSNNILQSRPPLSPIIRSKYARKQQQQKSADAKQGNALPSRRLRHINKQSSTDQSADEDVQSEYGIRSRTSSDTTAMLHSKYGSDDIEEMTAAKFSVNMEKYLFKTRGSADVFPVVQEKVVRSFEAQPFSRDCLFRKSPSPALRKPAVSAIRTLKTAEELFLETQRNLRGRSLSVPKESLVGILPFKLIEKTSGNTTPHSLPSSSPNINRKSHAQLLKAVTKRLSLPSSQLAASLADHGFLSNVSDSKIKGDPTLLRRNTKERKALVLEPVILDKNRQLRPHSVISYISEASESTTSESIWQKLVKPKSNTLRRDHRSGPTHKHIHGRPFKLFTRKLHHGNSPKQGTIYQLCMHTVTLDTSSESDSNQFLPDDSRDSPGIMVSDTSSSQVETATSLSKKKQKKKPFLDAKWLSRSKRFFKGSKCCKYCVKHH